jgi:uncharacterized protein (DUF2252 family)
LQAEAMNITQTDDMPPGPAALRRLREPRLPREDRIAEGKALRARLPRKDHAQHARPDGARDPLDILAAQNASRIAELVPVRMGRMLASPFAFLRGAAAVMAADLSRTPRTGLDVMACGDMHVSNFGLFASAERNLVFAINDFDEVYPGPWEWDLKRLAASAAVTAEHLGGTRAQAEDAAQTVVQSYVKRIGRYAGMGALEVWYDRIDETRIMAMVPGAYREFTAEVLAKAKARGHIRSLERLTEDAGGQRRLIEDRPIFERMSRFADGTPADEALDRMLAAYLGSLAHERRHLLSRYRLIDAARRTVGIGSVGTECWVLLLLGEDGQDPLFLQVKGAQRSVLADHVANDPVTGNDGHRVVIGQRLIQGSPDIFLGWGPVAEDASPHFYVRQLADMKGGLSIVENDPGGLRRFQSYVGLCGWALALAHAKSGEAARISGYCGSSDALPEAIGRYAMAYADQTARDHDALERAVRSGRVAAIRGV